MKQAISSIGGVLCSLLFYLFGNYDMPLSVLLTCMALDFVTGLIAAGITGGKSGTKICSDKAFKGILKKILILVLVILANVFGILSNIPVLRNTVITALILTEGLSIIENVIASGVTVPQKLKDLFLQKGEQNE